MKSPTAAFLAITVITVLQAAASAQRIEETVAVRGVVIDEAGAGVGDAVVSVRHHAETMARVRSSADGSFTIDVPVRSFDGVLLLAADEGSDRLGTLVHPDQGRGVDEPVRIVLHKAAKLEVTVTDAQGQFVIGTRVAATYHQQ